MSIEMGARGGLIGIDETTIDYVKDKIELSKEKATSWLALNSDIDAKFDKKISFQAEDITPMVTTGTSPDTGININQQITSSTKNTSKGLAYMGFQKEDKMEGKKIDYVFIGSCTNGRLEDLRAVADLVKGHKRASHVNVWVVPGSKEVQKQAIEEGLDQIFESAGFDFREPGCSACLAMNDDKIPSDAICISTSNRNFEGRQGDGAKTILASPITAAASAIKGEITDPRIFLN